MTNELDAYYREAREYARELITLIKVADDSDTDPDEASREIRGQIRQYVRGATPTQVWLLIHVLANAVAATYDDLGDWSTSVIEALADDPEEGDR